MDGDADEQSRVAVGWRPWAPVVGQQVRIRLSPECPALRVAPDEKETRTAWHSNAEAGLIGTVIAPTPGVWMPRMDLVGHPHLVDFTPGAVHFDGCIWYAALYFAATELELADEVDDGDRAEDDGD